MSRSGARAGRRLLAPEVIQISTSDCGPAALKSLLAGHGVEVSYPRLREACQTGVDGTSIDALEQISAQLGLPCDQIIVPVDHLLLHSAGSVPCVLVVEPPRSWLHFVVVWRVVGPLVQVMDPSTGRLWVSRQTLKEAAHVHRVAIPAETWAVWAFHPAFLAPLAERMAKLGLTAGQRDELIVEARADESGRSMAALDASIRLVQTMVDAGGLTTAEAVRSIRSAWARSATPGHAELIPDEYWFARPRPDDTFEVRGAVLLRPSGAPAPAADTPVTADLAQAREQPSPRPLRELIAHMRRDGDLPPAVLVLGILLAAGGLLLEGALFRAAFEIGRHLDLPMQRLGALAALLLFLVLLLVLELSLVRGLLGLGRLFEDRVLVALVRKLPRLSDLYLRSRLTADMAYRVYSSAALSLMPFSAGRLVRYAAEFCFSVAGIVWLAPGVAPLAVPAAALLLGLPFALQSFVAEKEMAFRTHRAVLNRFYLDALLGLVALRAHGAGPALRREYDRGLDEWVRSGARFQRVLVATDGAVALAGFALAVLVVSWSARTTNLGGALLVAYWALSLPILATEIVVMTRLYPAQRNAFERLLEPLGTPEDQPEGEASAVASAEPAGAPAPRRRGVGIELGGVSVVAGGHVILHDVELAIDPGSQVAILGHSGAGKSTLVGLLLGWHRPTTGTIRVDGNALDPTALATLREQTAWIDPSVQLWNQSLLANVLYGVEDTPPESLAAVVEAAELRWLLNGLPEGYQTRLGEGGALVSGGEGQRVRLARATCRRDVRLVILDEPFRGLDRATRHRLLQRARALWNGATILCITHDTAEASSFERVIIVDQGQVAEIGSPAELARQPGSRYRRLIEADQRLRSELWENRGWQRLWLDGGRLSEPPRGHDD